MREDQSNVVEQCKTLFGSANNGNAIYWELAKYMFNNINAVSFGKASGWFEKAGADDLEYIDALIELRDQYKEMYSEEYTLEPNSAAIFKGDVRPTYCDELAIDLLDQYDFSTEVGKIIIGMMKTYFATQCNLTKDEPEHVSALYQNTFDAILAKTNETPK